MELEIPRHREVWRSIRRLSAICLSWHNMLHGTVAERLKAPLWKGGIPYGVSGVRITSVPPFIGIDSMICETCHGSGWVRHSNPEWNDVHIPCDVCGGCGHDYCCGGSERFGQVIWEVPDTASNTAGSEKSEAQALTCPPE